MRKLTDEQKRQNRIDKNNETNRDRVAGSASDVESHIGDASLSAKEVEGFDTPVCITFYCTRSRLADVDNLSGKAAIDGIVAAGILADDSAKQVTQVSYHQAKGKPEKTVIVIKEVVSDASIE